MLEWGGGSGGYLAGENDLNVTLGVSQIDLTQLTA